MREKYETLSLLVLRDLAKARGLKGISTLRKPQLIDRMVEEDKKDEAKEKAVRQEELAKQRENQAKAAAAAAAPIPSAPGPAPSAGQQPEGGEREYQNVRNGGSTQAFDQGQSRSTYGQNYQQPQQQSQQRSAYNAGSGGYQGRTSGGNNGYQTGANGYQGNAQTRTQGNGYQYRQETGGNGNYQQNRSYNGNQGNNYTSYNNNRSNGNTGGNDRYRSNTGGGSRSNTGYRSANTSYRSREEDGYRQEYYESRGQQAAAYQAPEGGESQAVGFGYYQSPEAVPVPEIVPDSRTERVSAVYDVPAETVQQLDSGEKANGILEVLTDGYGFIRCENYMPGENDIYVSPSQIRRFNLKTGDIIQGNIRIKTQGEKFSALLYVTSINGFHPSEGQKRFNFEDMTPVFPHERIVLERPGGTLAMRVTDLISPIGKGQRGMIVSPPKAGKTTLLKDVAKSILRNTRDVHLIILLIDERPEEVTDIREAIQGSNVEVIYSTFDETPEHHKRVSEMVIERAKRLVEHKKDVVILLDSITRLSRAYNLIIPPSGRTLSGGLDPAALHMPKRFFGAARKMREGGSLTILATALVETGSKMDDMVYEEFKGTGNMELILDRKLQEKRIFPAIDIQKSGTRREDLLLTPEEQECVNTMRRALNGLKSDEAAEQILNLFAKTKTNKEFVEMIKKQIMV